MSGMLDLLYPRRAICMGCEDMVGLDRDDLCEDCRMKLAGSWTGVRTPNWRMKLDGAAYAYNYSGPAGGMVRNLKYGSAWVLAEAMGADVARAAEQMRMEQVDFVSAVPMHPKRLRERGRNHAELLARSAAAWLEMDYCELMYRTRNAPQQARLSAKERRKNLVDAFAVLPEYRDMLAEGAAVLLIDDVCTTGATAKSCAEALRSAGARRVYFAAYAIGRGDERG